MTALSLTFAPLLPIWIIATLALAAAALILARARAGGGGLAVLARLAAGAVLALALLNPQLEREKRQPLKDIAVIVTDASLSQSVGGRMARARAAQENLRAQLSALPDTEARFVTLPPGDGREGTKLMETLRETLADIPPERFAGAILITDGRAHDAPKEPRAALPPGYAGPVHVLIDGRRAARDRRVVIDQAARYGIVGKDQTIRFHIAQTGGDAKDRVRVTIRLDGEEWGVLTARPGKTVEMELPVAHAGQNIAEIIAAPMPGGELSMRNNHAVIVTRGVRDRLRVLLISGKPHPGERVWRNLLKADPSVDLVHFTILRPPEKQDGTPIRELSLIAFPTRELFVEKLDSFDLIIFDRYQRRSILPSAYMDNVAQYVRNGGAVLLTAGPEYAGVYSLFRSALAGVIPARPAGGARMRPFRPRLTKMGLRHPVTRGLSGAGGTEKDKPRWGRWLRIIPARAGEGAQVVMKGPSGEPLLVLARKGEGRIATLLSDHIWLWARGYDGGGPYVEIMRRLAHWLMKEPDLEEEALTGTASGNGLLVTRRTMADKPEPVRVTGPDGKSFTLAMRKAAPGVWKGMVKNARPGLYRLKSGNLERLAASGGMDNLEMRALSATDKILAPVAKATGGAVRWIAAAGDGLSIPRLVKARPGRVMAGGGWLGLKQAGASRLLAVERTALFATLPMLALALLLLGLAWWTERR